MELGRKRNQLHRDQRQPTKRQRERRQRAGELKQRIPCRPHEDHQRQQRRQPQRCQLTPRFHAAVRGGEQRQHGQH